MSQFKIHVYRLHRQEDTSLDFRPEITLGPVCPNIALSAAIVMSQTICKTCPPPTA